MLEIVIDDREPREFINFAKHYATMQQFSNFKVIVERIPYCDVICRTETLIGKIGIEIKRGTDVTSSIIDGRIPNQAIECLENKFVDNFMYVIEGDFGTILQNSGITPSAFYGAIAALQTKYKCSLNVVPDDHDAILLSFYIFKHSNLVPRTIKISKGLNKKQRQLAAIMCIPDVGEARAKLLSSVFTLRELATITDPDEIIKRVGKGIGSSIAQKIVNFFDNSEQ